MKGIIRAAATLTVIAAVAAAALAGTNALTADRIAQNVRETANAARATVIAADEFEEQTAEDFTYYVARRGGETVGYVFTTVAAGKSAGLTVMTGVDTSGKITGVAVTEQNETAGYVDKVTKGGLLDRLVGRSDAKVDGVSQATKTSGGVKRAVNEALSQFEKIGGVSK